MASSNEKCPAESPAGHLVKVGQPATLIGMANTAGDCTKSTPANGSQIERNGYGLPISNRAIDEIFSHKDGGVHAAAMYALLSTFVNGSRARSSGRCECWPSLATLARHFGKCERATRDALSSLLKTGVVTRINNPGFLPTYVLPNPFIGGQNVAALNSGVGQDVAGVEGQEVASGGAESCRRGGQEVAPEHTEKNTQIASKQASLPADVENGEANAAEQQRPKMAKPPKAAQLKTTEGRDEIHRELVTQGCISNSPADRLYVHALAQKAKDKIGCTNRGGFFKKIFDDRDDVEDSDSWIKAKQRIEYAPRIEAGKLLGPNQPRGNGKGDNPKPG